MASNTEEILNRIFFYGTLKKGQPNHYFLSDNSPLVVANFIGKAKLKEQYPLIVNFFYTPMLLHKPGYGRDIFGEIYDINKKLLDQIDIFEGHPTLYRRTKTEASLLEGSEAENPYIQCEAYFILSFSEELLTRPFLCDYDYNTIKSDDSLNVQNYKSDEDLLEFV